MEPEGSLPCPQSHKSHKSHKRQRKSKKNKPILPFNPLQIPFTGPYPVPDESIPCKMHVNNIIPSTSSSSYRSLSLAFSYRNTASILFPSTTSVPNDLKLYIRVYIYEIFYYTAKEIILTFGLRIRVVLQVFTAFQRNTMFSFPILKSIFLLPWSGSQKTRLKRWYIHARVPVVKYQKMVNFIHCRSGSGVSGLRNTVSIVAYYSTQLTATGFVRTTIFKREHIFTWRWPYDRNM
jgi:hypothetical protein